jgi:hypothetical protein
MLFIGTPQSQSRIVQFCSNLRREPSARQVDDHVVGDNEPPGRFKFLTSVILDRCVVYPPTPTIRLGQRSNNESRGIAQADLEGVRKRQRRT